MVKVFTTLAKLVSVTSHLFFSAEFLSRDKAFFIFLLKTVVLSVASQTVNFLTRKHFIFTQTSHWDELWHKVGITVRNPRVSTLAKGKKITPPPRKAGLGTLHDCFSHAIVYSKTELQMSHNLSEDRYPVSLKPHSELRIETRYLPSPPTGMRRDILEKLRKQTSPTEQNQYWVW